jgi:hypothetical protein
MEMQQALQGLEKRIRADYRYVDGEMAAYLNFICSKERESQGQLFGHLIQFHGMLESNGDRNDDTFIGNDRWQKVVTGMKPKWEEICDKVLKVEAPLTPEDVGEIIADAIEKEKKDVKKRAILSWILRYGRPGFVPYVVLPEISSKAKEVGPFELDELNGTVREALQKVKAIHKSPLFKTPLMEAAAIQEILDGIEDPMQRAVVLSTYALASGHEVKTSIRIMGIPGGLSEMLAGSGLFEALMESRRGPGLGGLFEALTDDDEEPNCAECEIRLSCTFPAAKKWRAENA